VAVYPPEAEAGRQISVWSKYKTCQGIGGLRLTTQQLFGGKLSHLILTGKQPHPWSQI